MIMPESKKNVAIFDTSARTTKQQKGLVFVKIQNASKSFFFHFFIFYAELFTEVFPLKETSD